MKPLGAIQRFLVVLLLFSQNVLGNPHAKKLYDELLANYNRLIRPVSNNTEKLTVKLGLKLSQLIDVDLKNQIMTTNVWVEQKWFDYKLRWNPDNYGGVDMLYVPSQNIWLPDIVLFNNADGKYEVTLMTKATLKHTGEVSWKPPAIYKSSCKIDVEWFPFDEQTCDLKFGSWTYDGFQLDLKHMDQVRGSNVVQVGIDLSEFYLSVEWDILDVPATRNEEWYSPQREGDGSDIIRSEENMLKEESMVYDEESDSKLLTDITFYMTLRRKTLFYTVNLIIPCVGISFLTVLVFYLPSDSGEKVTLCISILLSLTVFFLLLAEIIPPTSLAVPLLGKYLLFTMILVSLSICVTVGILNIHFRSPSTHKMSPWVRKVFIVGLPKLLFMDRPNYAPRYSADIGSDKSPAGSVIESDTDGMHDEKEVEEEHICDSNTNTLMSSSKQANGHVGFDPSVISPTHSHAHTHTTMERNGVTTQIHHHHHHHYHHHHHFDATSMASMGRDGASHSHLDAGNEGSDDTGSISIGKQRCEKDGLNKKFQSTKDDAFRPISQVAAALKGVEFIAQHIKKADKDIEVIEDWKYIAMVLDRLFLWIFAAACLGGFFGIILRAPSLYDLRRAIA